MRPSHQTARRSLACCAILTLTVLGLATSPAAARPAPGATPLPKWETPEEKARAADAARHKNAAFRTAHPELYAVTSAPVTPIRFYAEHSPVSHVYYTWFPGTHDTFFWGITDAILQHGGATVSLVVEDGGHRADLEAEILGRTGQATLPAQVEFLDLSPYPFYTSPPWSTGPLDSYWFVDYGPHWVVDGAGTIAIVDPRYYFGRTNDDAVPAKLADLLGLTTFRPDLNLEGGNFMSDGEGTCVLTRAHQVHNLPLWPYQVDEIFQDYFGCDQTIWLEPLEEEGTGHVDMFARLLTPDTFIVGEYTAAQDAANAAILDENAARLAAASNLQGQPFQVVRIPMPNSGNRSIWRTYTNGILVNDLVLVPTYANETTNEAAALAVYQSVLPGKTVIGLDSDEIIDEGGAVHCVTRTRPAATAGALEPDPAEACGGAWDCPPTGCGDVDYTGVCIGETSAYCDNGQIVTEQCIGPEACGWDLQDSYVNCVPAGCGALDAAGQCDTVDGVEFALYCDADGYPRATRCLSFEACGLDAGLGRVACQDTGCTNECDPGEAGCEPDGVTRWSCGEAGDGDTCRERILSPCDPGDVCEAGACTCADACAAGETGCEPDGVTRWSCGEAGDGDDCLDRVTSPCGGDLVCQGGECVPPCVDECTAGETGCASDLSATWVCGEAGDGDDCLDRVPTPCGEGEICRDGGCEPEKRPLTPGKGCGCQAGGEEDPGSSLLLLLALGLLVGRRRRR